MGCNCGNKRRPLGSGSTSGSNPATGTAATRQYVLQTKDGKRLTFGSRLEASAARVRYGGGSIYPS